MTTKSPPPPPRATPRVAVSEPSRPEPTLPGDIKLEPTGIDGRHVTLCVTGSVAAYKAVQVARLLVGEGATVDVVLTRGAREFIGPATFAGITGRRVLSEMFDSELEGEPHVALAKKSDLVLVAPATADVLARLAEGRADDLLTALVLCA